MSKKQADLELARRAKAGDIDARNQLVMGIYDMIQMLVRRLCNRFDRDPDDFFGSGFEAALGAIHSFDPERGTAWTTWAGNAAVMRVRSEIAREWKKSHRKLPMDTQIDYPAEPREFDDEPDALVPALRAAMAALPAKSRKLLIDRFVHEQKLRELAERDGITKERVRQKQIKALAKVRELMDVLPPSGEPVLPASDSAAPAATTAPAPPGPLPAPNSQ